jgi:hypothetical protein
MERRKFLQNSSFGAILGLGLGSRAFADQKVHEHFNSLGPVLLPPLEPLDNKNGLNIWTWVRSEMTGGVYSSVECAVAPKTMGPPPHITKNWMR